MLVAGIREFRNQVPQLIKSNEIVFVTRHGKLLGMLVPFLKPESLPIDLRRELLVQLGHAISSHLKKRGVSEKRILRDFKAWRKKRRAGRG